MTGREKTVFCSIFIFCFITINSLGFSNEVSHYDLGNRYFVKGDYKKAIEEYSKILDSSENEFRKEAMYMTGKCFEKLGNSEEADRIFQAFIDKYKDSPENPEILLSIATNNIRNGQNTSQIETLKILDKIIADYPDFIKLGKVYEQKIKLLIRMEAWSDALELIDKLIKGNDVSNLDRYYFNLAEIYSNPAFGEHDYKKALDIYNKIISQYPKSELVSNCYFSIAHVYKATQDWQNAIKYYRIVSREYPGEVLGLLANTMVQLCNLKRNEYLYGTKSRSTLTKIFGDQNISKPSLEDGIRDDIEGKPFAKLNIYANDSFKNPERAVYTGNVNIEKGDLKIQANNVECDLKNQVIYIKGDAKVINQKGLVIKGEKIEFDVAKNRILASDKLNVMTVKNGNVLEKTGNNALLELDSGRIMIDNVEYKGE
jgi:TolA-binding protein